MESRSGARPKRVKIWSVTVSRAEAAGTGQPICASTTATHVARSSVLLPARPAGLSVPGCAFAGGRLTLHCTLNTVVPEIYTGATFPLPHSKTDLVSSAQTIPHTAHATGELAGGRPESDMQRVSRCT